MDYSTLLIPSVLTEENLGQVIFLKTPTGDRRGENLIMNLFIVETVKKQELISFWVKEKEHSF